MVGLIERESHQIGSPPDSKAPEGGTKSRTAHRGVW